MTRERAAAILSSTNCGDGNVVIRFSPSSHQHCIVLQPSSSSELKHHQQQLPIKLHFSELLDRHIKLAAFINEASRLANVKYVARRKSSPAGGELVQFFPKH